MFITILVISDFKCRELLVSSNFVAKLNAVVTKAPDKKRVSQFLNESGGLQTSMGPSQPALLLLMKHWTSGGDQFLAPSQLLVKEAKAIIIAAADKLLTPVSPVVGTQANRADGTSKSFGFGSPSVSNPPSARPIVSPATQFARYPKLCDCLRRTVRDIVDTQEREIDCLLRPIITAHCSFFIASPESLNLVALPQDDAEKALLWVSRYLDKAVQSMRDQLPKLIALKLVSETIENLKPQRILSNKMNVSALLTEDDEVEAQRTAAKHRKRVLDHCLEKLRCVR